VLLAEMVYFFMFLTRLVSCQFIRALKRREMRRSVVRVEGEYGTCGSMSSQSSGGREVAVIVAMVMGSRIPVDRARVQ